MPSRTSLVRRVAVLITTVGMVAFNLFAVGLPLFGRSTAEVSARYPVLVTPAGYVFSIWGLIYIGMLTYSVAQFFQPLASGYLPDRLALPLVVSNVANVVWLILWHALQIPLTVPVMLVLLGSLIVAYWRAHRDTPERTPSAERWLVRAPLGLYLGWVSVATIANISVALYATGWRGEPLSEAAWALIMLVVAAGLALLDLAREGDAIFAGVFVWALIGIAIAQDVALVVWTAAVLAAVVAVVAVATAVTRQRLV